jgi:rRNA-processing protein FCF1
VEFEIFFLLTKAGVHMGIPKLYLETTMFNYYFDTDRDAHIDTVILFEECAAGKFDPFTSDYVLEELEDAPADKREKMLALIKQYDITVLPASHEIKDLADRYISDAAIPKGSKIDAQHIAAATVWELDMIVSLNFRHIVRPKTIELTGAVNKLRGYRALQIVSPMEMIDSEKTRYHLGRDSRDTSQD